MGSVARGTVFAFWHGSQLAFTGLRRRKVTSTLVSWSRDGTLQAGVLTALGLNVVRGSCSRGGATALRSLLARLGRGDDVVLAVDGPRGPRGRAKAGALVLARYAGSDICALGSAASCAITLQKTWDRFVIPLPFARVAIVVGAPLSVEDVTDPARLSHEIERVTSKARTLLAEGEPGVVRYRLGTTKP